MKKIGILKLCSIAAFAAAGAFAIASAVSSKSVEPTKAADPETITIYCTQSLTGYGYDDAISLYQWGGESGNPSWGDFQVMTKAYTNNYGQSIFKAEIPNDREGLIFVFWKDSNLYQTVNVETGIKNNAAWYLEYGSLPGGSATVGTWSIYPYTINYHGNGSTSGSMSSQTAYDDVDWGLTANSYVKTGSSFAGWNTKADGTGVAYGNNASVIAGTMSTAESSTLDLYAQWVE